MDVTSILLYVGIGLGGYLIRHFTGSPTTPSQPSQPASLPAVPVVNTGHPVLDQLANTAITLGRQLLATQPPAGGVPGLPTDLSSIIPKQWVDEVTALLKALNASIPAQPAK